MSIRAKVILGLGTIFTIVLTVFIIQFVSSQKELLDIEQVEAITLRSALLADDVKLAVVQVQQFLQDVGATRDGGAFAEAEEYAVLFRKNIKEFEQLNPSKSEETASLQQSFEAFYQTGKAMAQDYISGGTEMGNRTMGKFDQAADDINLKVDQMREAQISRNSQQMTELKSSIRSQINVQLGSLIAIFVLGCVITYVLLRSLLSPIRKLIRTSSVIAAGDLSQPVVHASKDEFSKLAEAFEQMRSNLASLISNVQTASLQVASSAEQLSSSADENAETTKHIARTVEDISTGAEQQSQSTLETSRAIEEMTLGVQRIAESTGFAAGLSADAERQAKHGYERIESAMNQMRTIHEAVNRTATAITQLDSHSAKVTEIVSAIREITQKTTLLALNASIEAAHAGENGAGFVIVANEIRKLADQTNRSSEQITEILGQIEIDTKLAVSHMAEGAREVENGMVAIDHAGVSFGEIMKASENIACQIQEASASTEEMSASSQQISASVAALSDIAGRSFDHASQVMDTMQEQLSSMEEIAVSTRSLSELAEQLEQKTIRFKV